MTPALGKAATEPAVERDVAGKEGGLGARLPALA